MEPRTKLAITLGLLALMGGLGAADYYYSDGRLTANIGGMNDAEETLPPGAVAKYEEPEISQLATDAGLETAGSNDTTVLSQVIQGDIGLETINVLKDGDRAGSISWISSPNIKTTYATLKDALLNAFSSDVTGLNDQTVADGKSPVYNILSFRDPALSSEKLVFIRVRERIYELHIADGKDDAMEELMEELVK